MSSNRNKFYLRTVTCAKSIVGSAAAMALSLSMLGSHAYGQQQDVQRRTIIPAAPIDNQISTQAGVFDRSGRIALSLLDVSTVDAKKVVADAQQAAEPQVKVTLNFPYGVAVDPADNIYVTNFFGDSVTIYNKALKLIGTISAGISYPAAVAIDSANNIYVANNSTGNITIYSPAYAQISTITDSNLLNPTGMYVDDNNDVWVLDASGAVHLYLDNNTIAGSSGATHATAIGPTGPNVSVWGIPNSEGGYDENFVNTGEMVYSHAAGFAYDVPDGSPFAGGEAEDTTGLEYVSDFLHNQIQIWYAGGNFRMGGGYSQEVGLIDTASAPTGVAVDKVNKRLYVAEPEANVVVVYSIVSPYKLLYTIH